MGMGEPQANLDNLLPALGEAVSGVLTAVVALADPETIVVGGPWGSHPAVLDAVTAALMRWDGNDATLSAHVVTATK